MLRQPHRTDVPSVLRPLEPLSEAATPLTHVPCSARERASTLLSAAPTRPRALISQQPRTCLAGVLALLMCNLLSGNTEQQVLFTSAVV